MIGTEIPIKDALRLVMSIMDPPEPLDPPKPPNPLAGALVDFREEFTAAESYAVELDRR